ncbi:MAG: glycosyltransferase family 2 protein [Anaerolineae bacterium]|nr:glycosyltransferase family 2 protein [Anaerolineae bacterium]
MSTVSVVVTNWNGKIWLDDCLRALQQQTYRDFEIIFVDDGSTDGSADWVAEHFPTVRLIRQQPHLGFAGANNLGIKAASGKYIAALNNDTRPAETWLEEMVKAVNRPDIGMVAAQIVIWDNPDLLDSAGIEVDWAGFGWNRGWQKPVSAAAEAQDVFGPCAAAALYRREMLDEIGLFDENFYAYYEDVDLAWRAQRAGWRCRYAPTARVLHHHSATGRKFADRKVFLLNRNKIWTILKNYDGSMLLWTWPVIVGYDFLSLLVQTGRTRSLAPLKARWQALIGAPRVLSTRRVAAKRIRLVKPHLNWPL